MLHQEIGLLPERYRSAVVLCYLEGLTHEAAAERLGRPVGTVRSRLATARDRLRARLTRRGLAPAVIPALTSPDAVSTSRSGRARRGDCACVNEGLAREDSNRRRRFRGSDRFDGGDAKNHDDQHDGLLGVASVVVAGIHHPGAGVMAYSRSRARKSNRPGRLAEAGRPVQKSAGGAKVCRARRPPLPRNRSVQRAAQACRRADRPARGPIVIQAETVDEQGEAALGSGSSGFRFPTCRGACRENSKIAASTVSDDQGRGRLQVSQSARRADRLRILWAYKPGRALATAGIPISEKSPPAPVRLVLDEPVEADDHGGRA